MGWMKFDDGFLDHPKFVRLEALAPSRGVHLFLGLVAYCKRYLTDGRVPRDMLSKVSGPHYRWRRNALDALIAVGLVEVSGDDLLIHDYLDWQPSRRKILGAAKGETDRATHERDASDNGAMKERQPTESEATRERQHIKRGKVEGLSHPSLTRARADSDSDSDSDPDDQIPLGSPQLELAGAESQSASTSEASPAKPKRAKTSRAPTRCPDPLTPDPTTADEAWELGFSDAQLRLELRKVVDWAKSKSVMRADWQATARNWLRKAAPELGLKARPPRDERWASYQTKLANAKSPVKDAVPPPPGFEQRLGSLGA